MSPLEARRAEFLRLMRRRTTECKRCEGEGCSPDEDRERCTDCGGYGLIFLCDTCEASVPESDGPICDDCQREAERAARRDMADRDESDEARETHQYASK